MRYLLGLAATGLFLSLLSSCASNLYADPATDMWCEELEIWAKAGPRVTTDTRELAFFIPPYEDKPNTIVFKSVGFQASCDDNECLDKHDQKLIESAFSLAHYYGSIDLGGKASHCSWSPNAFTGLRDFDAPTSQTVIGEFNGLKLQIDFLPDNCSKENCVRYKVDYK